MEQTHESVTPGAPDFLERMQESFSRQKVMTTLGATLHHVSPGRVEIAMPFQEALTQQHGFLHAGVITTIVDSACGYAAYTLMPPDASVLTVEYHVNFLSPAQGTQFLARGTVIKAGRTLTVCSGEVLAWNGSEEKLIATMSATVMTLTGRPQVPPG